MKIAMINAVCGPGSTGAICRELADSFLNNGHECVVYYGNRTSTYRNAYKIANKFEVKLNSAVARITGLQGYFSYISTLKCILSLKKFSPNVVHIHNVHGNFINVPILLSYLKKHHIRTVITLHDCWFYTGKCTHYTEASCYRWKEECGRCPKLKADIPSIWFDCTSKMLKDKKIMFEGFPELSVIAVSDWICEQAKQSILKHLKIETIYNWVDLDTFHLINFKRKSDKFIILGVSAKWTKDSPKYQDFLKLSSMIGKDEEIWLVGEHEDSNLPHNIKSIPYVDGAEKLAEIYNLADVYVHLAREDSFGKVIIEALACGTPAVTYDTTAYPEIVCDGVGYISAVGNLEQIYNNISKIKSSGKSAYSQACIARAARYEKNRIISETFKHYTQSLK